MSFNDFVSDFVARINNAIMVKKPVVTVLKSNLIINITKKLVRLGYFAEYTEDERTLDIVIDYNRANKLKRFSKPGQRQYVKYTEFPKVVGGKGFNIVTTSQGIMTNHESKQSKVGGELLFQIY
jgi:small subunit ribosomal protein S8